MEKIFLIYETPSDYESHPKVIGFKTSEIEAKELVDIMKLDYNMATSFEKEVYEKMREYRNTYLPTELPKLLDSPRWTSGLSQKDITQEMRDERKRIHDSNQIKIDAYNIKRSEYDKNLMLMVNEFCSKKNKEWLDKWFTITDTRFKINVEFLVENHEYFYEECDKL